MINKSVIITFSLLLLILPLSSAMSGSKEFEGMTDESGELRDIPGLEEPVISCDIDNLFNNNGFFTENSGQLNSDDVRFYVHGKNIWFLDNSIVFQIFEPPENPGMDVVYDDKFDPGSLSRVKERTPMESEIISLTFEGANQIRPLGIDRLSHVSNFFYGNDTARWRTNVPNYREIIYENIYDNIDLRYYFNIDGLKYEFIVRPGGDPDDITISIDGAEKLFVDNNGDLVMRTRFCDLYDRDLFVYQETVNGFSEIPARIERINPASYKFMITTNYDLERPLIIDPLITSTFLGGSVRDRVTTVMIHNEKTVYIYGFTYSSDFPSSKDAFDKTYNGSEDLFVSRMDLNLTSLKYSTYIGGNYQDFSLDMDVDSNGDAYLTGNTKSDDFPTTPGAFDRKRKGISTGFACKLNSTGDKLIYSTFFGDKSGDTYGYEIIVDNIFSAYVAGYTTGNSFPTTPDAYDTSMNGGTDSFIMRINSTGTGLLNSTVFGGSLSDITNSIMFGPLNRIYVSGSTESLDFPINPGAFDDTLNGTKDIFLMSFDLNLTTLINSTLLGGIGGYEVAGKIRPDDRNNIWLTGYTSAPDFPVTSDAIYKTKNGGLESYLTAINSNLSVLYYSTFLGGSQDDWGYDFIFDDKNNIIATGHTSSFDFPVTGDAFDNSHNGNRDVYLTKINITTKTLIYSTYIGGGNYDVAYSMDIFKKKFIYIGGECGSGFPSTANIYDSSYNGGEYDGFVFRFHPGTNPKVLDLGLSKPSEFRSNTITLTSNASDVEDNERALTPYFEYRHLSNGGWSNEYLSPPEYVNNAWTATLTIPINFTLGLYSFRVYYNDTEALWSSRFYKNNSFQVLNNVPVLSDFSISKNAALRGETVYFNCTGYDIEDRAAKLTAMLFYKSSSSATWYFLQGKKLNPDNSSSFGILITDSWEFDHYDFFLTLNDTDAAFSNTLYLYDSLWVRSLPPRIINIVLSKSEIFRSEDCTIEINTADPDTAVWDLNIELYYKPTDFAGWSELITGIADSQWGSTLRSEYYWTTGIYDFKTRAVDEYNNTSPWFYLNKSLLIKNNIPEISGIEGIPEQSLRNRTIQVSIDAADIEDAEALLTVSLEYFRNGDDIWRKDYLSEPVYKQDHWQFDLLFPLEARTGVYNFRAVVSDLDNDFSRYFYLNDSLTVYNSRPEITSFTQTPAELFRTRTISLEADGKDMESKKSQLGFSMYYQLPGDENWKELDVAYDINAGKWTSELATTADSIPGRYSFKAVAMDADGDLSDEVLASESVLVKNNLPIISSMLDELELNNSKVTIILTDYGTDIETPDDELTWELDISGIDKSCFTIETANLSRHQIVLIPGNNIECNDNFKLILTDGDGGCAEKMVTVLVNSIPDKSDKEPDKNGEDGDGAKTDDKSDNKSDSRLMILIIVIICIVLILLFLFHRRIPGLGFPGKDDSTRPEQAAVEQQTDPVTAPPAQQVEDPGQVPPQPTAETAGVPQDTGAPTAPIIQPPPVNESPVITEGENLK